MSFTATTTAGRSLRRTRLVGATAAVLLVPVAFAGPAAAQEEQYDWVSQAYLAGGAYTSPEYGSRLEVAADGDLLAAWSDSGAALVRRSADAGRTWGALVVAVPSDGGLGGNVAVAGSAGSTLVVTEHYQNPDASNARYTRLGEDGSIESVLGPVFAPDAMNRVAATASGYVALHDIAGSVVAVASHDDGRSFAGPVELGRLARGWGSSTATYDVSAVGNDITVAWSDDTGESTSQDDVVMTRRSVDGGRTWLDAVPTDIIGGANALAVDSVGDRRVVAAYTPVPEEGPFTRGLRVTDSADAGAAWSPSSLLGLGDPVPAGLRHIGLAATDDGFVVSTSGDGAQFHETVAGGAWQPTGIPGRSLPAVVSGGTLSVLDQASFSSYVAVAPQGPPPLEAQPSAAGRPVDDSCPAGRVPSAQFGDVTAGAPHADSVDCVVWWKVAGGRSSTQYAPAAPVNRAQMATFIANAIEKSGDVLPEPSQDWFGDDNGTTHERNINRLAEAGVISGRAPGVYAPDGPVSRGAMAKFLAVSYEYTSGEELPGHVDYFADDNGHVLELFVNQAASVGLAAGSGSGYNPGGDVRRDQMATFIARWLDLVVERFDAELPDEG